MFGGGFRKDVYYTVTSGLKVNHLRWATRLKTANFTCQSLVRTDVSRAEFHDSVFARFLATLPRRCSHSYVYRRLSRVLCFSRYILYSSFRYLRAESTTSSHRGFVYCGACRLWYLPGFRDGRGATPQFRKCGYVVHPERSWLCYHRSLRLMSLGRSNHPSCRTCVLA
jgi:hypothetical protein